MFRIVSALAGGALTGIAAYIYMDMEYAKWPMERRLYIAAGCAIIGSAASGGIAGVLAGRAAQKR